MSEETKDSLPGEWLDELIDREARPLAPQQVAVLDVPPPAASPVIAADTASQPAAGMFPDAKTATLRSIFKHIRDSAETALRLLEEAPSAVPAGLAESPAAAALSFEGLDRTVEGVFDGEHMVGDDGKTYTVPPNYASKSKLVEGDLLKLTIGARGNFIFKQIGPIERQRLIGNVAYDQASSQFLVLAGGRSWHVLKASMTYFKAEAGDEAVILVPKNAPSKWAAVENVIRKPAPGQKTA